MQDRGLRDFARRDRFMRQISVDLWPPFSQADLSTSSRGRSRQSERDGLAALSSDWPFAAFSAGLRVPWTTALTSLVNGLLGLPPVVSVYAVVASIAVGPSGGSPVGARPAA